MSLAFAADVTPTQKLVLLALCDSANDQGECYPAMQTLAEKCSLSERATQSAVSDLERTGHLRRELRRGRATVYWLTPAAGAPRRKCTPADAAPPQQMHPAADAPPPPQQAHPRGAADAPPQQMHPAADAPGGAADAPITITQTQPTPKTNTAPASPPPRPDDWLTVEVLMLDGLDADLAASWLAHRRAKKAKLTALAWRGFKSEADKAGWGYGAAVIKAISRNWTGFEAAWVQEGRRAAPSGKHTGFERKNYREGVTEDGHIA
jgi:hypothetical protein